MKKKLFISVFVLLCGLSSCLDKGGKSSEAPLPVLDFRKEIPEKIFAVQDLGKVRYVRFKTDSVLLGDQMRLAVNGGSLFFYSSGSGEIVGFDKNGNKLCSFNRKGQGGEEYTDIRQFVYDEARKEIFLYTIGRQGIAVYDLDGTYKRLLPVSDSVSVDGMMTLDKQTLILLDMKNALFIKEGEPVKGDPSFPDPNEYPFVLLDKETGEESRFPAVKPTDRFMSFVLTIKDGKPFIYIGRQPHLFPADGQCLISEPASDTAFALSPDQSLTPLFTRLPSVREKEGKISCALMASTPQTMLIEAIFLKYQSGNSLEKRQYLYNVSDNNFSVYKLANRDFKDHTPENPIVSDNKLYFILYPYMLLEALNSNKLSGELQEIARTLNEEDNPILMEVALK